MLILNNIPNGEEPLKVPLWHLKIKIKIHDQPFGLMTERVDKQLIDFFGEFWSTIIRIILVCGVNA